jgi:hypothetical protein
MTRIVREDEIANQIATICFFWTQWLDLNGLEVCMKNIRKLGHFVHFRSLQLASSLPQRHHPIPL